MIGVPNAYIFSPENVIEKEIAEKAGSPITYHQSTINVFKYFLIYLIYILGN
jgi:hypothetical protein